MREARKNRNPILLVPLLEGDIARRRQEEGHRPVQSPDPTLTARFNWHCSFYYLLTTEY